MSLKQWGKKVLQAPGPEERVRAIEDELRLESGRTVDRPACSEGTVRLGSSRGCDEVDSKPAADDWIEVRTCWVPMLEQWSTNSTSSASK